MDPNSNAALPAGFQKWQQSCQNALDGRRVAPRRPRIVAYSMADSFLPWKRSKDETPKKNEQSHILNPDAPTLFEELLKPHDDDPDFVYRRDLCEQWKDELLRTSMSKSIGFFFAHSRRSHDPFYGQASFICVVFTYCRPYATQRWKAGVPSLPHHQVRNTIKRRVRCPRYKRTSFYRRHCAMCQYDSEQEAARGNHGSRDDPLVGHMSFPSELGQFAPCGLLRGMYKCRRGVMKRY